MNFDFGKEAYSQSNIVSVDLHNSFSIYSKRQKRNKNRYKFLAFLTNPQFLVRGIMFKIAFGIYEIKKHVIECKCIINFSGINNLTKIETELKYILKKQLTPHYIQHKKSGGEIRFIDFNHHNDLGQMLNYKTYHSAEITLKVAKGND